MCDRTIEFRQCVAGLSQAPQGPQGTRKSLEIPSTKSAFQETTADIAIGIHRTTETLAELTKLVRRQGLFDDPTEKINNLIVRIKEDISSLNAKCDAAQSFVESSKKSSGAKNQAANHKSNVVTSLKGELMNATQGFKSALELRSDKMKTQQERKLKLTGSSALSPMHKAAGSVHNNGMLNGIGGGTADMKPMMMSSPYDMGSMRRRGNGEDAAQMQQQMLIQPPSEVQYYEQRQEAVGEVERTIGELGQLFKRLSTMISQQQELVERVDEDIESAVFSADQAQSALMKTYESVSSNKGMYMKISAIMLIFIIFFVLFMM